MFFCFTMLLLWWVTGKATSLAADKNIYEWRGDGSGKFLETKLQKEWGREKSVVWKTPLKNWSNASPIIVDGKIFICAEPTSLICLDQKSGKILWETTNGYIDAMDLSEEEKKKIASGQAEQAELQEKLEGLKSEKRKLRRILKRKPDNEEAKAKNESLEKEIREIESELKGLPKASQKPKTHKVNGYTSYTPVSDGKAVYVANGLGIVAAYDLEGKRLWIKKMAIPDHGNWGGSTTPLLAGGKLIVRFADMVALDPKSGAELWRTPSKQNFGTPVVLQLGNEEALFTNKGEVFLVATGEKLSDLKLEEPLGEKPWATFNKPVVDNGVIYTVHGFNGKVGKAMAFEIPKSASEAKNGLKKLWEADVPKERYYASLIVHDGKVFTLGHSYSMTVLEAKTGEKLHQQDIDGLKGTGYPSLVLSGHYLLVSSDEGQTAVLNVKDSYAKVALNELESFRSSPVFVGDRMFLRAFEYMYAIE